MNWNFKAFILQKLNNIQSDLGVSNYNFYCEYEQDFIKNYDGNAIDPKGVYILIKNLTSSIEWYAETQPCQLFVLSGEGEIEITQAILRQFAQTFNFYTIKESNEIVKMQYSDPVVLSNFNILGFAYRSVLYISTTLYITNGIYDVGDIYIDGAKVKALAFSINYAMTPNTQQLPSDEIATSVKTVSSLAITLGTPVIDSVFIGKVLKIMDGDTGGDTGFAFNFTIGSQEFKRTFKLTSSQFITGPDTIPALTLSFIS